LVHVVKMPNEKDYIKWENSIEGVIDRGGNR
jgi:hypothetical protein